MIDQLVLSRCNLFGVMKNLEYLAEQDEETKSIAQSRDITINFIIRGGPRANINIRGGSITLEEGKGRGGISLFFTSPEHFNRMVAGEANPVPLKGFTKIGYLTGPFTKMTERLEYFLRPRSGNGQDPLKDKTYFTINTEMTLYAAFFALAEIANTDAVARKCAAHIPDGIIQVRVEGGPGIWMEAKGGRLTPKKGVHEDPRTILGFKNLEVAHAILNNKTDTYTSLALGDMSMKGFIPMIEYMDPILGMVPRYLA